jgi:diguanylate cyclase (GGDEF)-like protein
VIAAIVNGRRLAFVLAACSYIGVFCGFVVAETPGLGLGHFYYLPICIIALASGPWGGALAGCLATALYTLGVIVAPPIPSSEAWTTRTLIRLATFLLVGGLVGWYARRERDLVAQLRRHAGTDFVTGVANVRAFDEGLSQLCADGRPFTLVLVDVNDLHRINEIHGRRAGDGALRAVAEAIVAVAEPDVLIARIGSDEFALLTQCPLTQVPALGRRIDVALQQADVTVTVAATASPADGVTAADLMHKADDRLFTAKLVRTNRAVVAAS